jgi:hypothetical protein
MTTFSHHISNVVEMRPQPQMPESGARNPTDDVDAGFVIPIARRIVTGMEYPKAFGDWSCNGLPGAAMSSLHPPHMPTRVQHSVSAPVKTPSPRPTTGRASAIDSSQHLRVERDHSTCSVADSATEAPSALDLTLQHEEDSTALFAGARNLQARREIGPLVGVMAGPRTEPLGRRVQGDELDAADLADSRCVTLRVHRDDPQVSRGAGPEVSQVPAGLRASNIPDPFEWEASV